jgi:hypothetical protein
MALSKIARKLLLSESISLKLKNRTKRKWVHEFSKQRPTFGEFYHLYRDARVHPEKLKDYLRMSKETFDTLFKKRELHLCGPGESISTEQRLVVTVS